MAFFLYLAVILPFAIIIYHIPQRQMAAREKSILALRQRMYGSDAGQLPGQFVTKAREGRQEIWLRKLILLIEGGGFSTSQARGLLGLTTGMLLLLILGQMLQVSDLIHTPGLKLLLFLAPLSVPGFIAYRISNQRKEFVQQLPDAIEAMVRALEAGNSPEEAIRIIAEEFPSPISGEFRLISKQLTVGLSFKETLFNLRNRLPLPEVQYLVLALIIQRDTGGQLARILAHLAALMRRRMVFDGKLKALTAETRFTALFISGVPLLYIGYRYFFKRAEMLFFLSDPTGILILQSCLGLIFTGIIILKYMLRIRF